MKRSTKHQFKKVQFAPLNGGVNVSQVPEQIAENEMQLCENFWYEQDTQRLVGRGGLQLIKALGKGVKSMFYDIETNTTLIFTEDRDCYKAVVGGTSLQLTYLDKVSGNKIPQCVKFKNQLFIASGSMLQFYDFAEGSVLQSITTAPHCDKVFYRFGRLAVAMTGSDRITYSSVGDATSDVAWIDNTNDDSSSKWLDVGYDDGGDIVEIVPLATDMIIFKSNGKAYQLVGDAEYTTWAVYNVANFTDMTNDFAYGISATNLGQEVAFLSLRGLKTLSATQDYGNSSAMDIGSKFNKLLTTNLYEPEFYHLRRHKVLIIRPTSDHTYFVVYNYGINAATVFRFAFNIDCVLETKDDILVGANNSIYRLTIEATQDDNQPITYTFSPRSIEGSDKVLVKSIDTHFVSDHAGEATLTIGDRLNVKVPTSFRHKLRCNHSEETAQLTITSNSRFGVGSVVLDIADL